MLRGCQKRIYYVKNPESDIFDEAYFILRRGAGLPHGRGDGASHMSKMKLEAERLMADAGESSASTRMRRRREKIIAFFFGICASAAAAALVALIMLS